MDPEVWGKLLTHHRRGYGVDVEALRDRYTLQRSSEKAPRWDLMDTKSCGGGIRVLAPILIVWGYVCIYRRKEYVSGAPRGPRGRGHALGGGRPPPSWPPLWSLGVGSKSLGSRSVRKSRFRRFYSVWTPFDILFLRNTEIGKKQQFWAGPPVNRLVPKII